MVELRPNQSQPVVPLFNPETPDRPRLFAVLEGNAPGRIFADDPERPDQCVVREDYFGRVFFSRGVTSELAEDAFERLRLDGQVVLDADDPVTANFAEEKPTRLFTRLEFISTLADKPDVQRWLSSVPDGSVVIRLDEDVFDRSQWRDRLLRIFGSTDRYLTESIGYGLLQGESLLAEAHAFFWGGQLVEVGTVTHEQWRGRGYGSVVTAHLVVECEERGYTTYWGCELENKASAAIARHLGYGEPREYHLVAYPSAN